MDWTLIRSCSRSGRLGFSLIARDRRPLARAALTLLFTAEHFPRVVHMAVATATAAMVFTSMSSVRAHQQRRAVL
jgi:hypothetical protein